MSQVQHGTTRTVTADRSLVLDLLYFSRKVPSFSVERWFDVAEIAEARCLLAQRISWAAMFIKAMGLASRDVPELRQFYLPYPWPRIHQTVYSVISLSINRVVDGADRLFWGRFQCPERTPLLDIQAQLSRFQFEDPRVVFKRQFLLAKLPMPLRRVGWWWRLFCDPGQRARRLGSASISTLSSQGVLNRTHPNLLTASLDYGPLQADGRMWITLLCDHRVLDGVTAARAVNAINSNLCERVLRELRGQADHRSQAA